MKTLEQQLEECLPDWTKLVASLIPEIADDYRATDDPDDNEPGMCLTVGFTPALPTNNGYSWHYQTGDNSYSGGAYGHAFWAVVYLSRESVPAIVAAEIADELGESVSQA